MSSVTMREIAIALGLSVNTVSLALRGSNRVAAETATLVRKTAEDLGYIRNPLVGELMASIRKGTKQSFSYTIALINAHWDPRILRDHATIPDYIMGLTQRGREIRCAFDNFWLHDPKMTPAILARMLQARGIRGCIFIGLRQGCDQLEKYRQVWSQFPCVSLGVPTAYQGMSWVGPDHFAIPGAAIAGLLERQYRRPGFMMLAAIDDIVEGRYSAGFTTAAKKYIPTESPVPPLLRFEASSTPPAWFSGWFRKYRPDSLVTYNPEVRSWLEQMGVTVPGEVGVVLMDKIRGFEHWARIDQENQQLGELAMDSLVKLIGSWGDGGNKMAFSVQLPPLWIDGETTRPLAKEGLPQGNQ